MTQLVLTRAWPVVVALLGVLATAPSALAHRSDDGGGMRFEEPAVTELRCGTGDEGSCPRGQVLRLSGENLAETRSVTFLGGRGRRDNRIARPNEKSPHRVLVDVPAAARSGRLRVVTASASATGPRLKVLSAPPVPAAPAARAAGDGGVFPILGKYRFGTETNHFGGGRGHQGEDVFASCGTPLVAALSGVVTFKRFQDRAGHYVVIKADDGTGQAYMHLRAPATVEQGDRVEAGQRIAEVGDTGRASGCHLHFELWTAPGWYEGGKPIDPLPALQRWAAAG
jgi:murein DD-endopeptidase MepM/ murein hydrolase activator NlpD